MSKEDVGVKMSGYGFESRSIGSSVSMVSYEVSSRLEEEHIFPTKHKVECAFREYERNKSNTEGFSWLSLFLGILVSLLTSDTIDAFGVPAKVWSAVLISVAILAMIMLVKSGIKAYRVRDKLKFSYFYSGLKNRDNYGD